MKNHKNFTAASSLLILSLTMLPGCEFFKKTSAPKESAPAQEATNEGDASINLCSMNGKPVITENDFLNNMTQTLQANPYFKGASASSLPASIKRKFFDELVKQELIIVDAAKNNLEQDPEFQKAYKDMDKLVKRSLIVQFFEKNIYEGITVEDSEISQHFKENKNRYVKTPGGIQTLGIRFETETQASAFYDKAESDINDFEKIAKAEKNGSFKAFGRINKEDNARGYQPDAVPNAIREKVLSGGKLPRIEKVTSGKEFWVLCMTDKKDAEYFELDEIKPQISNMIKSNKFRDALDNKLKKLRNDVDVTINENYFKEKEAQEEKANENEAESHSDSSATAA